MKLKNAGLQKIFYFLIFVSFLLILSSCTVKYVADYDVGIRDEMIQISKKIDMFYGELLDTPKDNRKYDAFKSKYNEIEADIRSLVMKNEIRPLNKESTRQTNIALELWIDDKDYHKKEDKLSDYLAKRHREQFMRTFSAMIKGEEAKNISSDK